MRALLEDPGNKLFFFSAASLWEIAIKNRLRREEFSVDPQLLRRGLLEDRYVELPVTGYHAVTVDLFLPIHKNPFDRILVIQAQREGITLLTAAEVITRHLGPIRAIGGRSSIG